MYNKYGSKVVTLYARNLLESTVSPPSDFTLTAANIIPQLAQEPFARMWPQSNIIIRRAGVFCNFADGLVFKSLNTRLDIQMTVIGFRERSPAMSGSSIAFTLGGKAITGTGTLFVTESITYLRFGVDEVMRLKPAGKTETAANLADYSYLDGAQAIGGAGIRALIPEGLEVGAVRHIPVLNEMVEYNELFKPRDIYTTATEVLGIEVTLQSRGLDQVFLTKSINTAFANDPIFFDVGMEVEFTQP